MGDALIGVIIFVCVLGSGLLSLYLHPRLGPRHLNKETQDVIRLGVGMIVVMSSLVLGLMIASVKSSFDAISKDVQTFSTDLILLDRTLRAYGPEAVPTRDLLAGYTDRALHNTWPETGAPEVDDRDAGALLDRVEAAIYALQPTDPRLHRLATTAETQVREVVRLRWTIIDETGKTISPAFLILLVLWLCIAFASFGYNAPRNRLVVMSFFLCSATIAGALTLIIEMDGAFDGLIRVSSAPMERALDHMRS